MLAVPSEKELLALARKLGLAGVKHVLIREPDSPWNGAATAIGLVPLRDRAAVAPLLSSLPLLRQLTEAKMSA